MIDPHGIAVWTEGKIEPVGNISRGQNVVLSMMMFNDFDVGMPAICMEQGDDPSYGSGFIFEVTLKENSTHAPKGFFIEVALLSNNSEYWLNEVLNWIYTNDIEDTEFLKITVV